MRFKSTVELLRCSGLRRHSLADKMCFSGNKVVDFAFNKRYLMIAPLILLFAAAFCHK